MEPPPAVRMQAAPTARANSKRWSLGKIDVLSRHPWECTHPTKMSLPAGMMVTAYQSPFPGSEPSSAISSAGPHHHARTGDLTMWDSIGRASHARTRDAARRHRIIHVATRHEGAARSHRTLTPPVAKAVFDLPTTRTLIEHSQGDRTLRRLREGLIRDTQAKRLIDTSPATGPPSRREKRPGINCSSQGESRGGIPSANEGGAPHVRDSRIVHQGPEP